MQSQVCRMSYVTSIMSVTCLPACAPAEGQNQPKLTKNKFINIPTNDNIRGRALRAGL